MAQAALPGARAAGRATGRATAGRRIEEVLSSTDHQVIGYLYLTTSIIISVFVGVLALLIRVGLAAPGTPC